MKLITVTIKDLLQSSRSLSIYIFMFVIPMLITVLFYVMFGDVGGDGNGFNLPSTAVVVVNLDQGSFPFGQFSGSELIRETSIDLEQTRNMGDVLTVLLGSDVFRDLITFSEATDRASARAAVDTQRAGVAIIIPPDFTDAITGPLGSADLEIYKDPTLTFGPSIVESIVSQIIDGFSASKITIGVTMEQLLASGIPMTASLPSQLIDQFADSGSASAEFADPSLLVETQLPAGVDKPTDLISEIVSVILAGMMVFFAFYTGSASIQTILVEEEQGTLSRLFTTPNSHRTILGGKVLAAILTIGMQIIVLLSFGRLVYKIDWGDLGTLILAGLGLVMIASATGLFLVSLLDNTRQGGIVFGGVLTLTGMIGLIPVFTSGVPNQPQAVQTISLFVPQGWAVRGFVTGLEGGSLVEVLPTLGVLALWSIVFVFIGQYRLQRRFV